MSRFLAAVAAVLAFSTAAAAPARYSFTGTLDPLTVTDDFALGWTEGQQVTGYISYDPETAVFEAESGELKFYSGSLLDYRVTVGADIYRPRADVGPVDLLTVRPDSASIVDFLPSDFWIGGTYVWADEVYFEFRGPKAGPMAGPPPVLSPELFADVFITLVVYTADGLSDMSWGAGEANVRLTSWTVDVPEPATLALLALGLVGAGAATRRRARA